MQHSLSDMNTFSQHFLKIESLLKGYSTVRRATVQPYYYDEYIKRHTDYQYDPADPIVRESLLEHVGMLPIIATYLHPHLETEVDLGHVLKLLAIHDIGEVTTGDTPVFKKQGDEDEQERLAALDLLHPDYHVVYQEYITLETNEAKFAKSVDKLSPDLYDVLTDYKINSIRLACFTDNQPHEIPNLIRKHKSPYMRWNAFLKDFHDGLIGKLEEIYSK